ncbi:MAG: methanogen output domain 1-containing protein [Methanosarcinales archaeon]
MSKINCWKYYECKEKDCPAYKKENIACWLISETHCRDEIQGTFYEKIELCIDCYVFNHNLRETNLKETLKKVADSLRKLTKLEKIVKAQNQMMSIITSVIPILLYGAQLEQKNRFVYEMCNKIETTLWKNYIKDDIKLNMNAVGENLCHIMNQLGGDFEIYKVDDINCIIKGKACPWGLDAQRNPVLCMLCRCIFSRIAVNAHDRVLIYLDNTIGNRDDYCLIKIERY